MIHLSRTLSGPEIGRELALDPEDAAEALGALAQRVDAAALGAHLYRLASNSTPDELDTLRMLVMAMAEAVHGGVSGHDPAAIVRAEP